VIYRQFLFKGKLPLISRGLDAYALRQKTISKNIANITTPHYSPEEVKFEELFQQQNVVAKGVLTDEKHIQIGTQESSEVHGEVKDAQVPAAETYFSGESHVNIDKEMAQLAENQIKFRFAARMMKRYFQGLQSSITGTSG
jgi:flagellar basal-body rod protein FlgB